MTNKRMPLMLMASLLALSASAQKITTNHNIVDCGQTLFMKPITAEFILKNDGNKPLVINDVRTSCGCTTAEFPKGSIAAGESFTIKTTYDGKQMGQFTKQVALFTNTSDKTPYILTMRGRVVAEVVDFSGEYPYMLGELKSDAQELEFDDVNKGDRPIQRIHIQNPTDQVLEPVVMHLPNYLAASVSPSKVAPHRSAVVTIALDSKKLHDMGLNQTNIYLGSKPGDKVSPEKSVTVSAVLLPDFDNMTATEKALAPKVEISTTTLDLGAFENKKKLKGVATITNTGKSTLNISNMQVFTSGIQVSLAKSKIQPGETTKLKVTAIVEDLKKSRVKRPRILMITNDPTMPKVTINILTK